MKGVACSYLSTESFKTHSLCPNVKILCFISSSLSLLLLESFSIIVKFIFESFLFQEQVFYF